MTPEYFSLCFSFSFWKSLDLYDQYVVLIDLSFNDLKGTQVDLVINAPFVSA
jgi:hypothetical protein